jgi:hypothetical protein
MYNYENGLKRNNVGYARVEARNGQCKCTLHIAAPSLNDRQLKAYIFKRREKGLEGVLLGTIQVRNGYGDYKIITDPVHLMNSPYSLDDMGGIVIFYTDKKFFGTEWDNMAITLNDIATLEQYPEEIEILTDKEMVEAAAVHSKDEQDNNAVHSQEEMEAANFIIKKNDKEDTEEEVEENQEPMEEILPQEDSSISEDNKVDINDLDNSNNCNEGLVYADQLREDVSESEESISYKDSDDNNYFESEDSEINDENKVKETAVIEEVLDTELETNREEYNNTQQEDTLEIDSIKSSEEDQDFDDKVEQEEEITEEQDSSMEDVSGQECRAKEPKPFFEDHPTAMKIYRSFPRMYPFEDNEVAWCVRIEPQDIGMLPMDDWILANNSFLLHGYYSYRHLIFARINNASGVSYILGIPGIYHNREKFMAKMFGFENFKCAKRKERRTGEFGYWFIPIVLN